MNFTPDMNDGQHVFVFGSNENGHHYGGAARVAQEHWGAFWGVSVGMTGKSYAIPTLDKQMRKRSLAQIQHDVGDFIAYAHKHPETKFLVTAIGCGIAGFTNEEIAPLFNEAPDNCVLPDEWKKLL